MKDLWLRLGCYITGYNYQIIKNSSEASAKTVKKYLSAMLIISVLWGFIGFSFAQRYLHMSSFGALAVALIMVIIVIQIERQIILSVGKNMLVPLFRILIGVVMAVIGSVIIDQIIFREDVEKSRISNLQTEVNEILPVKTKELDLQIAQLDSAIIVKENERSLIIEEISKKPFIKSATTETRHFQLRKNSDNGGMQDTLVRKTDMILNDVANPKATLLPDLEEQISLLRGQKQEKERSKINIREELENELGSKTGFLDELKILFAILLSSWIAMVVWSMFFLFLMSIELLILVNKFGEEHTDYDKVILHQQDVRIKMLDKLGE